MTTGPDRSGVSEGAYGATVEERPLADACLAVLQHLAVLRGGSCRADMLLTTDEVLQDLAEKGLVELLYTAPMLVWRSREGAPIVGGPVVEDVAVYRITGAGRQVVREHQRVSDARRRAAEESRPT